MNRTQQHRGPDGRGVFEDCSAEVALGHVRLSILDLSDAAGQPMFSTRRRFVLVFNGEIFNFRELRESLRSDDEPFRSSGDTEVLLRGLERHGASFLRQLNGMFAFALWDRQKRELVLARDHFGIKPLYYTSPEPGAVLFASEIKALAAHSGFRREPNFSALRQHLAFCHGTEDETALRGVYRLPPGAYLVWSASTRSWSIHRYWIPDYSPMNRGRAAATQQLRALLDQAVRRQLVSDVPLGSFLSGGLDSSLMTAIAATRLRPGFAAYTISYSDRDNQLDGAHLDAPYARRLAQKLRLDFHEIQLDAGVAAMWPRLVYHLDEPIADPAAITCYLISRLAREHGSTVLLSGQGTDELFGGYPRYRALRLGNKLDRVPSSLRTGLARLAGLLPGACAGRAGAWMRRVRRFLVELPKSPSERFLAYCSATRDSEINRVLAPALRAELAGIHVFDPCRKRLTASAACTTTGFLARDMDVYLPNHNLLYTDKMGMAVGLEARVPFLDVELVDFVTKLPVEWKVGRQLKQILRDAARGVVPDEVIDRPKAGFGAPYRKWLRQDLREMWHDLTCRDVVARRGWFDHKALEDIRQRSQSGRDDLYMLQWAVLTIELWAQHFIDGSCTQRNDERSFEQARTAA